MTYRGARGPRIRDVETVALVDPGRASATIVRVVADDGLVGIGQIEAPSLVVDAVIRCGGGLRELLRGEDALDVERLWQKMYAGTGLFGRRGVTVAVIGAVETALWDLAGKALGRPVHELVFRAFCAPTETMVEVQVDRGGRGADAAFRERVVPYATVYPPGDDLGTLRERFGAAVARGFRAVKLEEWTDGFGRGDRARDVATVATVREIIGPDRALMLDVQNRWSDAVSAARTIRALERFEPAFVEAPLPPDNLAAYARLAREVTTPIAAGDWGFVGRFEFEDLLDRAELDIVQPSSVRSGGLLELLRIAEAAYRRGAQCIPHAWCHMVGVAAEVHLAAVCPNMPYIEFPLAHPDSPLVSELLVPALAPEPDGTIVVPKRPGLGFELDPAVVERYRVEPS
jgi:L-alanine-DL-glutamate epimerase-like enolase superfamily enzyme